MRVLSSDGCVNVSYEGNMFCLVSDEQKNEHMICVRSNANIEKYMPLATYDSKERAAEVFDELGSMAAQIMTTSNSRYYLPWN